MPVDQPTEMSRGYEKPEPTIEKIQGGEDVQVTAGIEAHSLHQEFGEEVTKVFCGHSDPLNKGYQNFLVSNAKIASDSKLSQEGREDAIAVAAKPFVEVIQRTDAIKEKYEEEVAATDASLLKAGMIQRPESIPEAVWKVSLDAVNQALEGNDKDPVKREMIYLTACEALGNSDNADFRLRSHILANLAAMESRVVFNIQKQEVEPFIPNELVNKQRMKRARLLKISATKKRDEKARLASAIGSITSLARQRVRKFAPSLEDRELIL